MLDKEIPHLLDNGEDLLIPISALAIERSLFVFDDPAVFSKNSLSKPNHERPKKVDKSWNRGLTNHHQPECMVDSLVVVYRDIHVPQV